MISFICKNLSTYFFDKLDKLNTVHEKYDFLKSSQNEGLDIVSCIGSHGLLREQIDFNILVKSGKKLETINISKGTTKKTITFKF